MKNLIGMTDFVLEQDELLGSYEDFRAVIRNYANFLKQPLELWLIVACDEDGNVLEEPKFWNGKYNDDIPKSEFDLCTEYYKAKKRCLFEGFKVVPFSNSVIKGNYIINFDYAENSNIESLLHHDIEFILTPTAQKQIGL